MSEFDRIKKIAELLGPQSQRVEVGIGDDAAILARPPGPLLVCTDAMVEGVHFDFRYTSPSDLGHKSLAACLSDIAAMNGEPLAALFSIAMPTSGTTHFLEEFYASARVLAAEFKVDIVGGDLSSSPKDIFIDVTCIGTSARPIRRDGVNKNDLLAVSGNPGDSAAGLAALRAGRSELASAHLRPRPRFDLLPLQANALIDVSDGVSSEAWHLARASEVGFVLDAAKFPISVKARALAQEFGIDPIRWFLNGGEDYELLAAFDSTKDVPAGFTVIGRAVDKSEGVRLTDGTPLKADGYNHFGG